jgi:UDP-N-acetylglucosamine 2-epimerase
MTTNSSELHFTSTTSNRNPLRIAAVLTLSLALVGGFLFDVARQAAPQAQSSAETRS